MANASESIVTEEKKASTTGSINLRQANKKTKLSDYSDKEIREQHRIMRDRVVSKKAKEKKENQESEVTVVKEKVSFSFRLKRWWFGMAKESRRISWATPKNLIASFIIILVVIAVLTGIFYGINQIFITVGILK